MKLSTWIGIVRSAPRATGATRLSVMARILHPACFPISATNSVSFEMCIRDRNQIEHIGQRNEKGPKYLMAPGKHNNNDDQEEIPAGIPLAFFQHKPE